MMEDKDVLGQDKPEDQLKRVKSGGKAVIFIVVIIILMFAALLYNYK